MEPEAPSDRSAFERAFVAVSHLLGNPDAPLSESLESTEALRVELARADRRSRAVILARELTPIAAALGARRFS